MKRKTFYVIRASCNKVYNYYVECWGVWFPNHVPTYFSLDITRMKGQLTYVFSAISEYI